MSEARAFLCFAFWRRRNAVGSGVGAAGSMHPRSLAPSVCTRATLRAPGQDGLSVHVSVLPALRPDPRRRLRQPPRLRGDEIHGKTLLEGSREPGGNRGESHVCEDVGDVAVAGVVKDEEVHGLEDELCGGGYGGWGMGADRWGRGSG